MKQDKRINNSRPLKYGEPKVKTSISITPTTWAWLQSKGGIDWLEKEARNDRT